MSTEIYEWISRFKYKDAKGTHSKTGRLAFNKRMRQYVLLPSTGKWDCVNQDFAEKIRLLEGKQGRPAYFDEKRESHTITMPKRIWDALEKPYSVSIVNAIEQRNDDGK